MFKPRFWGSLLLAGVVLPAYAGPFGWNADVCRKLEISGPATYKLKLKGGSAGSLQVMHMSTTGPVVETLTDPGDAVEISKAVSPTWWVGFVRADQGQEPRSPVLAVDLDLELSDAGGKLKVPFHVACQVAEPQVLVKVKPKSFDATLVTAANTTFIKAPVTITEKTREQDVLIKVGE